MKTATDCFQRISGGVRDALGELELLRTAQAALRLVTQLQDQEKNKLSQVSSVFLLNMTVHTAWGCVHQH